MQIMNEITFCFGKLFKMLKNFLVKKFAQLK